MERPLTGEPLSLDLLNTLWISRGQPVDLLADPAGLRQWLREVELEAPADSTTRSALVAARDAIRGHLADPGSALARVRLNEVLGWGRSRPLLDAGGPTTLVEVDPAGRRPAWLAAVDYLELLGRDAGRIRRCAHPDCVLHFYDTSPKGGRRWCSMAGCGNRAKAARHYARARSASDG